MIRIQKAIENWPNTDPDPQHWFKQTKIPYDVFLGSNLQGCRSRAGPSESIFQFYRTTDMRIVYYVKDDYESRSWFGTDIAHLLVGRLCSSFLGMQNLPTTGSRTTRKVVVGLGDLTHLLVWWLRSGFLGMMQNLPTTGSKTTTKVVVGLART